ncbi:hypothetical protein [Campylobacter ureolyticus]|uniref:hypothetical protein n=1 Tax=Campylobacter ureolyticus TaxID=827 RepID=UPI001C206956
MLQYWATKHNLNTIAESVIYIRKLGIKSIKQLDEYIQKQLMKSKIYKRKSRLLIRKCRSFLPLWSKFIPLKYRACYKDYRDDPSDKAFLKSTSLNLPYMKCSFRAKKFYSKLKNSKDILAELNKLQEKKYPYARVLLYKSTMDELYQIRKNYGIYMGKEMEIASLHLY